MMKISAPILAAILAAGGAAGALAATGDAYVYRISNGYNSEVRGTISYRVGKVDADRIEVAVTTDTPSAGVARTEVYTRDGNWLRHPLASHDQLRDYEFASALPVYADGGSWSVRVNAVDPATGKRSSVRVDGEVVGKERITVPAGTFDTVKIMRRIYAGDWDGFLRETNITELEWYAPAIGRAVRIESNSNWFDTSRGSGGGGMFGGGFFNSNQFMRGDWNVTELISFQSDR